MSITPALSSSNQDFNYKIPLNLFPSPLRCSSFVRCCFYRQKRRTTITMALKAVHVSDVPSLDQVPENASMSLGTSRLSSGVEMSKTPFRAPKFLVIGHRGNGMNLSQSTDPRFKAIKENSITSFNAAAKFPIDFVEFDVQVTKDGCPIIFHDNFILSQENGTVFERRVTDLTLNEFLAYGPQKEPSQSGKSLLRKTKDGRIVNWGVDHDDSHCTLQDAFQHVDSRLGFNIELKFDDHIVYEHDGLVHVLQSILQVVFQYANDRPIVFSSFQPDAALIVRKLQNSYPVFFLTDGGERIFYDTRRNSLEDAVKLCLEGGLQGIVSEGKAVFKNPGAIAKIKDSKLSLLTYGKLNNVAEAVYMQHLMGVDGVIVDLVKEITEAVCAMIVKPMKVTADGKESIDVIGGVESDDTEVKSKPQFSEKELTFLLKLIPQLIQE